MHAPLLATLLTFIVSVLAPPFAISQNLNHAPPAFGPDKSYVPIDISEVSIAYTFDIEKWKTFAEATVTFRQGEKGKPFFDIVPDAIELSIDGNKLPNTSLINVQPPGEVTTLRVLDTVLSADEEHSLTIKYAIHRRPKYGRGTVRVGFFVSDLEDRWFFERFGPTNLQFDQIKYTFDVAIKGAKEEHRIFANGKVTSTGDSSWRVEYPEWYNASTLYFHLTPSSAVTTLAGVYKGKERDIPVTVYNQSGKRLQEYLDQSIATLGRLEERLGATVHPKFIIYVHGGGGMEYAGATITSRGAIDHELTHSWYARGVFPADGNSSWVDESMASWQDTGYDRGETGPVGDPVNMAAHNVYVRDTDVKAYGKGRVFFTQLDYLFKDQGGLSPMLASFYQRHKRGLLTTELFRDHLQQESGIDMQGYFDRFVFGKATFAGGAFTPDEEPYPTQPAAVSQHPRRFTLAELYDAQ